MRKFQLLFFIFSGGFLFRSAPQKSGYPWFRYRFIASLRSATASPPLLSLPRFLYYIKNIDFYQKRNDFLL